MVKTILVTGATGRTGSLVLQTLRQQPADFNGIGFARSAAKVEQLFGSLAGFRFGDITDRASLEQAMVSCDALVILTSALPLLKAPTSPDRRPQVFYPPNAMPETIDYYGQKNQIDSAIAAALQHIVLVGSMGGTNPHHPLNKIGGGNLLYWKRQAEQYLINSGMPYTIIRAGGLVDQPGGQRKLLVSKHDAFLAEAPGRHPTAIPRADVADVVVQALQHPDARNKAFDLISQPTHGSPVPINTDFAQLFQQTVGGL